MKVALALSFLVSAVSFAAVDPGEKLFVTNCASCHGNDGKSQTDVGKAVKARNLIADEYKQVKDKKKGVTENDILETLKALALALTDLGVPTAGEKAVQAARKVYS